MDGQSSGFPRVMERWLGHVQWYNCCPLSKTWDEWRCILHSEGKLWPQRPGMSYFNHQIIIQLPFRLETHHQTFALLILHMG